jgi:hypothetical protein
MNLQQTIQATVLEPDGLYHGVQIIGFTRPEQEMIRATMSRIPDELIRDNVKRLVADRTMGAKHGRFLPETKTVLINPEKFRLRQRLGRGPGWIQHIELTMVHEFGHAVYDGLSWQQKQEWMAISGWVKGRPPGNAPPYVERRPGWEIGKTSEWTHKEGVKFVRRYAERNPDEDAADSFAFMMMNKGHQMAKAKRKFWEQIIQEKVHKYPAAVIESPTKAYGERGN